MESGARVLGHSIHPILIVFPLGLLGTCTIFDVIFAIRGGTTLATAAYWMAASGLVGGALAAVFGWIDWFAIPSGTRAKRVGLTHGLVNATVLVLFLIGWMMRPGEAGPTPTTTVALSVVGFVLALIGGWLGGELVERLGIAVHPGAHPDAPSSLSTEPIVDAGRKTK